MSTNRDEQAPTTAGSTTLTGADAPEPAPSSPAERERVEVATEHRRPYPEGGEHGAHPTEKQYIGVALVLAVLTGIEVAVSYIKGLGTAAPPLLIVLALCKFVLVVGYFMHLKFDNRVLRRVFTTGFILAIVVYVAVFLILGVFSTTHGAHA